MHTVWTASDDRTSVVPVECEEPGYPHRDVHGVTMYENTHFLSEADAWDHLLRNAKAGLSLATRDLAARRSRVREAEQAVVAAAEELHAAEENHERWSRGQGAQSA